MDEKRGVHYYRAAQVAMAAMRTEQTILRLAAAMPPPAYREPYTEREAYALLGNRMARDLFFERLERIHDVVCGRRGSTGNPCHGGH